MKKSSDSSKDKGLENNQPSISEVTLALVGFQVGMKVKVNCVRGLHHAEGATGIIRGFWYQEPPNHLGCRVHLLTDGHGAVAGQVVGILSERLELL